MLVDLSMEIPHTIFENRSTTRRMNLCPCGVGVKGPKISMCHASKTPVAGMGTNGAGLW